MRTRQSDFHIAAFVSSALLSAVFFLFASSANAAGIVASIDKAPVIADGNVTGKPANFVITLSGSLDPVVDGRTLEIGETIKVTFPLEFDLGNLHPAYPLMDVPYGPQPCFPGFLKCTTAVVLQGWPQHPFFLPKAFHLLSIDSVENSLTFTAVAEMGPNPGGPGIKQLHLILNGVTNPAPGNYLIQVEAQTGPGATIETGSGLFQVLPNTRSSINVTSVFVEPWLIGACGAPSPPPSPFNPIFQTTGVGEDAPYVWTFLLWDRHGNAINDVYLSWASPKHALLLRGNNTIGHLVIDAPQGSSGYGIDVNPLACSTSMPGAPVIGGGTLEGGPQPVGRWDLLFEAGDTAGDYVTTISLNNGNSVQMTVTAE